eukprot:gene20159-7215_t
MDRATEFLLQNDLLQDAPALKSEDPFALPFGFCMFDKYEPIQAAIIDFATVRPAREVFRDHPKLIELCHEITMSAAEIPTDVTSSQALN